MINTAKALLKKRSLQYLLNPDNYKKLLRKEKRMAIALDVIKSVLIGEYKPVPGVYIDSTVLRKLAKNQETDDVKTILQSGKAKNCPCCQLGACLLSIARFENKVTIRRIGGGIGFDKTGGDGYMYLDNGHRERLVKIFGTKQVGWIESAFERRKFSCSYEVSTTDEEMERIDLFIRGLNTKNRILAININIVQNCGKFIPTIPVKLHKLDKK